VAGPIGQEVSGISYDIRAVQPGCVFVAVAREKEDGHDCIDEAIDRGAIAVICERNGTIKHRATKVEVPRSAEALAIVASSFYEEPARKLKMIGVAGSFGQTSVAYSLRHLLERCGLKTGLIGSIHYQVGNPGISSPTSNSLNHWMFRSYSGRWLIPVAQRAWLKSTRKVCGTIVSSSGSISRLSFRPASSAIFHFRPIRNFSKEPSANWSERPAMPV